MIETKKFSLSKKLFFNIILKTRIKKSWWLYSLLILIGLVHLYLYIKTTNTSSLVWVIVCLSYPILIYIMLYRYAYSKNQEIFLSERKLFFDSEIIKIDETEGSTSEIPYKKIVSVKNLNEYWMLYLNKDHYFYIPKNIFYTKEDLERFEEYINR
ncbi:hypothetical protein A7A78_02595 [Aequorivita soesokkakensis]|uniref:YcxB-like C-terminal domain-containing protein n=2 Tax=Aequorivita soesokkakensis TaxID=1385699 RepID=A0A1A9LJX3_9FLAO|nr:hypothetical protein A7A78_02595 [Aequorivita soesokkakensis]